MFDIPFIKLEFHVKMLEDTKMPKTKVSALRGGMGEMLLRQNCIGDRQCEKCYFQETCLVWHTFYNRMEKRPAYMTEKGSVGYLIECEEKTTFYKKEDRLIFNLILFGDSIPLFNVYLQALTYLGYSGIGKHQSRFYIDKIVNSDQCKILFQGQIDMRAYRISDISEYIEKRKSEGAAQGEKIRIKFLSPFSMKFGGEFLEEFHVEALMKGIGRRMQMLNYYVGNECEAPVFERYPMIESQIVKKEKVIRYSGTHDSKTALWGIIGEINLKDVPKECRDYLIAGELVHVGKNSSFGFGKYRIIG